MTLFCSLFLLGVVLALLVDDRKHQVMLCCSFFFFGVALALLVSDREVTVHFSFVVEHALLVEVRVGRHNPV